MLARLGFVLITGGGPGIMEYASRGAQSSGGTTVGILPTSDPDGANSWCSVIIPTGLGHARNALTVLSADAVIAIGGSAGTLSELCFAWMYQKPIFSLAGFGGWADKLSSSPIDHRRRDSITMCKDVKALERELKRIFNQ